MRLSEAIRKGAAMRKQCFGFTVHDGGSCANMAAAEAMGMRYHNGICFKDVYHFLITHGVRCDVIKQIVTLNDAEKWTREQIADWVEREYESKLPQKERETDEAYARRMVAQIVFGQHQHTIDELNA